jgi:hypothetical protein
MYLWVGIVSVALEPCFIACFKTNGSIALGKDIFTKISLVHVIEMRCILWSSIFIVIFSTGSLTLALVQFLLEGIKIERSLFLACLLFLLQIREVKVVCWCSSSLCGGRSARIFSLAQSSVNMING